MRKLLLASTAGLGILGITTGASAQEGTSSSTQQRSTANPNYSVYVGGERPPTSLAPTPGSVVVRLSGAFRFYAYAAFDRDADNNASGTPTGQVNAAGQGTATGTNKQVSYGFAEFGRLYPGFDGLAANGLKYGVNLEIRQDQSSGAGGGVFGGISQQNRARGGMYFRREWAYVGLDSLGTLRFGTVDAPTGTYQTGTFGNFNAGGWNSDVGGFVVVSTAPSFPYSSSGAYYPTNRIVYLSPSLAGFDMGLSYEPSTAASSINNNCGTGGPLGANFVNAAGQFTAAAGANGQGVSGPGCDRLSSTPVNGESARRRNTFEALLRYRGSFGPVGVAATAAYIGGAHIQDNQTGVPFNNFVTRGTVRYDYDGPDLGDFGLAFTIGGLSFGGHYLVGRYNTTIGILVPKGLPSGSAWMAGVSYTAGPLIVGASYYINETAGDLQNAAQGRARREMGLNLGGTYAVAPGLSIFLEGLWGQRRQNGFNFITGQGVTATAPGGNPFSNKVTSSVVAIGTTFAW